MDKFKKIVKLIEKTGDKCIVLNPADDTVYVVLGLNDYEKMVLGKSEVRNLTEDELLDKINRDIAIWKSAQPESSNIELPDEFQPKTEKVDHTELENLSFEPKIEKEEDADGGEKYYFEPLE